jgi:hypothetical protein
MKYPYFKYLTYTIFCIAIGLAIWQFIALPLYKSYQYKKQDASSNLLQAFSDYEDVLFERTELNKKIQKVTDTQKSSLLQEIPVVEKKLAKKSETLDSALAKIKTYYHSNALLNKRINDRKNSRPQRTGRKP